MQTSLQRSRRLFCLLTASAILNFLVLLGACRRVSLPGDHMPGAPPVPIPNTAVKPRAANGSRTLGPARVGCCQVYSPVLRKKNRASCFLALSPRYCAADLAGPNLALVVFAAWICVVHRSLAEFSVTELEREFFRLGMKPSHAARSA